MKSELLLTTFVLSLVILVVLLRLPSKLFAQASSVINATVKISICGNGIKEGGEDCDAADFNSQNCVTQGYASGNLACDYSCSFDYSACINQTPTPKPKPTPTQAPVPTVLNTAVPTATLSPSPTPFNSAVPFPSPSPLPSKEPLVAATRLSPVASNRSAAVPKPYSKLDEPSAIDSGKTGQASDLPLVLKLFDEDNSGKIEQKEVYSSVKDWVKEWKEQEIQSFSQVGKKTVNLECDLDKDGTCTVKDFSLLMFNVER